MTKTSLRSMIAIQDMNVNENIGTRKALSDVVINPISITPHLSPPYPSEWNNRFEINAYNLSRR